MDYHTYRIGWASGFLTGLALGGLIIHGLTLLY